MRTEAQTSMHLLMAGTLTILSVMLNLITLAMSWELWTVPLIILACMVVWWLHIGRVGSEVLYENICIGLLLTEFFFFGVHESSLHDIPLMACIVLFLLSLLNRKRLLYVAAVLYLFLLGYHFLILRTVRSDMGERNVLRMAMGAMAVAGAVAVAKYRINRRKKEREKYESMQDQLATAMRQNADFLSNVSHELRTPINMVIGISEVTLGKDISPEIRKDLQSIKLAGKRLSSQISNILDYTEVVEGTLAAAEEPYMITSVVNDIIAITVQQNSGSQLEIVFDVDPRIPSVLIGDVEKITHVIRILLENALKFTEEGGIDVQIGCRRESYGVNLLIDISDTGIGMNSSQIAQMLDDFYQADSGSRRYVGGLGLGLPVARGLLHAMGGFIHFESGEQQGMQVHVTIPQGVEDDTPCISVPKDMPLCIACFFKPERYSTDEVRKYYDNMILHMVEGLGVEGYQAHNFEGLLKLQREHKLTHLFIAETEYMANPPYYEEMARSMPVAVIAGRDFDLDEESRLMVLRKPFFALTVVNMLSGHWKGSVFEEVQTVGRRPFTCEGVRVLSVDDEEMNLVVAKGVLGSYGIQVDTCISGKAAVERCMENTYDMIFLDHMMPGFDGVETLRRIREINNGIYKELPVIALTANTISGAREMFRNEGFTEFIPKPIERTVLERVLRRILPEDRIHFQYEAGAEMQITEDAAGDRAEENLSDRGAETGAVPVESESAEFASAKTASTESGSVKTASAESASAEPEPFQAYGALVRAGIDVGLGLDYCGGEDAFYLEMLQMFRDQEAEKEAEIAALYEAANWGDYAIKVHALKSTALTIGAAELSGQAKALEQAGKAADVEYIRENHSLMLQSYREICESIDKYLS